MADQAHDDAMSDSTYDPSMGPHDSTDGGHDGRQYVDWRERDGWERGYTRPGWTRPVLTRDLYGERVEYGDVQYLRAAAFKRALWEEGTPRPDGTRAYVGGLGPIAEQLGIGRGYLSTFVTILTRMGEVGVEERGAVGVPSVYVVTGGDLTRDAWAEGAGYWRRSRRRHDRLRGTEREVGHLHDRLRAVERSVEALLHLHPPGSPHEAPTAPRSDPEPPGIPGVPPGTSAASTGS
jgi:hypothetical protein